MRCDQIATELEGRSSAAVSARAAKLGLTSYARQWSSREEAHLLQMASAGLSIEVIARTMVRTPTAIRLRGRRLGLRPPSAAPAQRGARRWTAGEDDFLRLHSGLNPAVLAQSLGRTPEAVGRRLRRLHSGDPQRRSPHYVVTRHDGLTPGQQGAIAREMASGGPRRHLALANRLELPLARVLAVATANRGVPRSSPRTRNRNAQASDGLLARKADTRRLVDAPKARPAFSPTQRVGQAETTTAAGILLVASPALPQHMAGKYVAAAYIVFVALLLIYVSVMAARLGQTHRALTDLEQHIAHPSRGQSRTDKAPNPGSRGTGPQRVPPSHLATAISADPRTADADGATNAQAAKRSDDASQRL
jgi:hypothetical protein